MATIGKNGLLDAAHSYKNGIQNIKVGTFPPLSQAAFLVTTANPYAAGFLIYVEMVAPRDKSPILNYKVLFGSGTETDFKAGYRDENGIATLYVSRPSVNMSIQCLAKTSNVELSYVSADYPEDCTAGTKS